jgi:hypothetical protein
MIFALLQTRLIGHIRAMIQGGEMTERGLAQRVRASQPHVHNILKGARSPSPELCDHLIRELEIPIERLLTQEDLTRIQTRSRF